MDTDSIDSLISKLTDQFSGREWVFQQILTWLNNSRADRVFLLTGEPGSGKSAIAARLTQFSQGKTTDPKFARLCSGWLSYTHFCRNRLNDTLAPIDFVEGLSQALKDQYPEFAQALSKASLPGIQIQNTLTINRIDPEAQVTMVSIGSLSLSNLSAKIAFDQYVRRPLNWLYESGFKDPIVILVDALDEALAYDTENNLVTLIRWVIDHPSDLPRPVRFILTSRPDERVLHLLGADDQATSVSKIDLIDDAPPDEDDVRRYALLRLQGKPEQLQNRLAEQVAKAGKGNFLYARYVLDELISFPSHELETVGLPKGLEGIYRQFIERELARNLEQWDERYQPILGMLAVARGEGIYRRHLEGAAGLPPSKTNAALRACKQFLTGNQPGGPFRFYHQSFRDFLLKDSQYRVYPQEANQAIAELFLREYGSDWWNCQDKYAWRFTASHLGEALELLSDPLERSKREALAERLELLLNDAGFLGVNFVYGPGLFPSRIDRLAAGQERTRMPDGSLRGESNTFETIDAWLQVRREHLLLLVAGPDYDRAGLLARWLQRSQSAENDQEIPETNSPRIEIIEHFCTPSDDPYLVFAHLACRLAGCLSHFGVEFNRIIGEKITPRSIEDFGQAAIDRRVRSAIVDTLRRLDVKEAFETAVLRPLQSVYTAGEKTQLLLTIDSADAGLPLELLLHPDLLQLPVRLLLTCQSGSPMLQIIQQLVSDTRFVDLDRSAFQKGVMDLEKELIDRKSLGRFQQVDHLSLTWLALVPGWTEELAEACNYPAGSVSLEEFLERGVTAGWCERAVSFDSQGREIHKFWIQDTDRQEALDQLEKQYGFNIVQKEAAEIGARVLKAREQGVEVPYQLGLWAELALRVGQDSREAARWLEEIIRQKAVEGNTIEAQAWANVGVMLAKTMGGEMATAAEVGERRIELAFRRSKDERALRYYLPRQTLLEVFDALLEGDGQQEAWALHFMGPGGIGKTSLLRYISTIMARDLNLITCRIDFDYLNPGYPGRQPAGFQSNLIAALGTELSLYFSSRYQEDAYHYLQERIYRVQDRMRWEALSTEGSSALETPEFQDLLNVFVDLLRSLSGQVVLMLDTCEELQKLQAGGGLSGEVLAAFDLVEELHKQMPSLRVVLAGRRLLSSAGFGWQANMAGIELPKRPYLRLFEIQGFDENEAGQYLQMFIPDRVSDRSLVEAILQACRQSLSVPSILQSTQTEPHYLPFELALYANWIREDPQVSPETIQHGVSDVYLVVRILNRIRLPLLLDALPAVVLLGRFDREMLRPAIEVKEDQFEELIQEMIEQEWVSTTYEIDYSELVLEIDPYLRPRMMTYYQAPERKARTDTARKQLAGGLVTMVRNLPLKELNATRLSAALRLATNEQAAALLQDIIQRVIKEEAWAWALPVLIPLLGEDDLSLPPDHPLRPEVTKAYETAQRS